MARPKKTEASVAIEKRLCEMEKDKPKVYNIMDDGKFGQKITGQRFTQCAACGVEFEQNIAWDYHRYSTWKTCPSCRSKLAQRSFQAQKAKESGSTYAIPYEPLEWQKEAYEEFKKHRFQVLACGVRAGKDKYSISVGFMYFIECLNENRHIHNFDMVPPVYWWIIAPTFKLAEQNWRQLKVIVKKTFRSEKEFVVACDNGSMTMQTVGGGVIEVRSAFNEDMLVGVGLDLVTITEAARIKDLESVWANIEGRLSSPGRGLEIDRKGKSYGMGKAIINSSPLGENYFYKMFKWGVKGSDTYSSDWCSLQFPWTANPANAELARQIVHTKYGDITREQDMIARLGLRRYEQDFLGKFLPSDDVAFKDFMDNCVTDIYAGEYAKWSKAQRDLFIKEWQEVKPYGNYRISYDPATGSSSDSPVLIVRDMDTNNIVRALDMYGKSYEQQWDTIAVYSKLYNHAPCVFSDTGHTPVIGQLEKRGVPEIVLHEQASLKGKYIQSLVLAVQNKDLHILFDGSEAIKTLCAQMNDYKEKNGKYGNDEEPHDDFVSALYLNYYDYGEQINEYAYAFDFMFM
ncbi:MAG TPA: hypothetical protein PK673_07955 [Paludibacteraceae bacterium]|mgnify:CR=1 FL=1|nr:hypothetical protein [Paludibacteraceae bacterium]